jgi:hypothetical protein
MSARLCLDAGGWDGCQRRVNPDQGAFSLYLNSPGHYGAIVVITEEGAAVFGLTLDDPNNAPETLQRAGLLSAAAA